MQNTDFVTKLQENSESSDENPAQSEIYDDAKRSVSIRINISDYGKIKTIARRLRVKESIVFRYLLKNGLQSAAPFYQGQPRLHEVLEAFFEQPEVIIEQFNLDQRRFSALFNGTFDVNMAEEDIELLSLIGLPRRYLAQRLSDTLGHEVAENQSVTILKAYLLEKYPANSSNL